MVYRTFILNFGYLRQCNNVVLCCQNIKEPVDKTHKVVPEMSIAMNVIEHQIAELCCLGN